MEQLIFTRKYENVVGYGYPQPIERVNGLKYNEFTNGDKSKEKIFADLYWAWANDKRIKDIGRFDSELYGNCDKESIYNTIKGYKHYISVTPFFDFEIYLMSLGAKLFMGGLNTESGRDFLLNGVMYHTEYGVKLGDEYYKFAVISNNVIKHMPTSNFDKFMSEWQA
jgi:hypothetical protein